VDVAIDDGGKAAVILHRLERSIKIGYKCRIYRGFGENKVCGFIGHDEWAGSNGIGQAQLLNLVEPG